MKTFSLLVFSIFYLTTPIFISCGERESERTIILEIQDDEVAFWPSIGEKIIYINSNSDVQVESADLWCQVEMISNQKNAILIKVEKNDIVGIARSTKVLVKAGKITKKIIVNQLSEEPRVNIYEKTIYFNDNQTRNFSLNIASNIDYTLDIPKWIEELESENVDVRTVKHHFSVQPLNQTNSSRNDKIVVKFKNNDLMEDIAIPVGQSNKKSEFSAASYNILVGTWQDRKDLIYMIIDTYDFDIWGTQEGTLIHLTDIKNHFNNYDYIGLGRDGGENGEYSAIFYKKNRFEVLEQGNFWYSNTPEKPSYGWDATNYRRICSWGKFRDKETYNTFYFFNSHFDHQGTVARLESAKLLLTMIKTIVEPGYPIFASGDFNCTPDSEPITIIKHDGLLSDARELLNDPEGPEGTYNSLKPNEKSNNRIDFIFVTKNIGIKKYKVIDDRPNGKCPSDHDPVLINACF